MIIIVVICLVVDFFLMNHLKLSLFLNKFKLLIEIVF